MGFGRRAGARRTSIVPNHPGHEERLPLGQWRVAWPQDFKAACLEAHAVEFGPQEPAPRIEPADDSLLEKVVEGTVPLFIGGLGGAMLANRVRTKERLQQEASTLDGDAVSLGTVVEGLASEIREEEESEEGQAKVLDRVFLLRARLGISSQGTGAACDALGALRKALEAPAPAKATRAAADEARARSIEDAWETAQVEVRKVTAALRHEAEVIPRPHSRQG